MSLLAVAMVGAVMLITDYAFDTGTMIVCTAAVALAFLIVWYAIPLRRLTGED